jgi:RNA exonuclease 1
MANPLASLKSLPCPAGDSCTAFQCVFSHPKDRLEKANNNDRNSINNKPINGLDASATLRTHPADDTERSMAEQQPRKRARLDVNGTAASSPLQSELAGSVNKEGDKQRNGSLSNTSATIQNGGLTAVLKPKSPLSSKMTKQTTDLRTKPQQPVNATPPAPPNTPRAKVVTQPKQTSKAPESLNPRLLKKAPATHATRVALVKALHKELQRLNDELKKTATDKEKTLLLSDQELIVRTLDEEQEVATKKTAIYNTSIRNRILTFKKMTVDKWKEERTKEVDGDNPPSPDPSAEAPPPIVTGLTPLQEVKFLSRYFCDLKSLTVHGFISEIPSEEAIRAAVAGVKASGNNEVCDRCTRRFQVFPGRRESDGALASNGPCIYHPGKMYYVDRAPGTRSSNRDRERKYRCCQRSYDDSEGGCTTSPLHVFKTTDPDRLASVLNFVETPNNPNIPEDRAVCFDCEMGYTVFGLELIRLTAVSWPESNILLDILVQPVGEILDLNTRYSGVQPEDMALAEPCELGGSHEPTIIPMTDPADKPRHRLKIASSPQVARDIFFTIVSNETPLIGHGIENDLNALRIIHPAFVDTAILYPHPRGLPMRNGLKLLMDKHLKRTIQTAGLQGHDSAEDAKAAGDLVRLKIKDDWQEMVMKGWCVHQDGNLVPPSEEWTIVGGAKVKKRGFW